MSTVTFRSHDTVAPVLVSELPASSIPARPSLWARLRADLAVRREARSFERAVRFAGPTEYGDLLAARRRY
ncbi:MAG: hypothetical protein JWM02_99 [Frankiales bacterium]|nr:hypothetical protein [Frankiales bacterium]